MSALFAMRPKNIFKILFVIATIFISLAHNAHAQPIDLTQNKEVPDFRKELPEKQFLDQTNDIEERPKGDAYLAFNINIPKKWSRIGGSIDNPDTSAPTDDVRLSRRILGKIVKYYSTKPFEPPSSVQIEALELDRQITARNWLIGYVLANGFSLQGLSIISETRAEAMYITVVDTIPYVVRTMAIINGPRMVLVSYYAPEPSWPKERALQQEVVGSFKFISMEKSQGAAATRTYAFLDLLRFDYPVSWRLLAPSIYSIQGMDARLLNSSSDNKLLGEINVRIISTETETSLPQEISYLKQNLKGIGLEVGNLIETPSKYKYRPQVTFARVEVYNAFSKDKKIEDHEYWLAVMAENRFYYIVSMVTPSRTADFYNWAQNTEAFQMIVQSVRP